MGNKNRKMNLNIINELVETTHFTTDEMLSYYKEFIKNHPSGYMTPEEYKIFYSKLFPSDVGKTCEYLFLNFDSNRDGMIDFKELITALSIKTHGTLEDKIGWVFKIYDIDENGYITRDEMYEILTTCYKFSKKDLSEKNIKAKLRTDEIFEKMDLNNDDRISFEEFLKGVKRNQSLVFF